MAEVKGDWGLHHKIKDGNLLILFFGFRGGEPLCIEVWFDKGSFWNGDELLLRFEDVKIHWVHPWLR